MAHAVELGLGNNSIGWTFPLFNKGGSDANILSAYQWVISAFSTVESMFKPLIYIICYNTCAQNCHPLPPG